MSLISAENIQKNYQTGEVTVKALKSLSFEIEPASFVSFVGPSESGKTTLLNLIGCLDKPTQGTLKVVDTDVLHLDRKQSASFRGSNISFIFQDFNLIPVLTVYENIEYPLLMVQSAPYLLCCAGLFRSGQGQLWQLVLSERQRSGVYHSVR
jgi:putative ABC transport system ATP-binding protein